jgi:hypothetical protein
VLDEGVIVEIVRPGTGDPVPEGEVGEVVVTVLNPDYPLIRFGTGDLSAVLPGTCPTGRTNTRIKGWMGRADQTTKVRGMFVHPGQVAEVVRRFPEVQPRPPGGQRRNGQRPHDCCAPKPSVQADPRRRRRRAGLGAHAQSFPAAGKPITIVVPFAAGGPTDKVARDLGEVLRKPLNGNQTVDHRERGRRRRHARRRQGGQGRPDGYTLLLHHIGMATTPGAVPQPPTRRDDFEYLGLVNEVPMTLVGRRTLPANNYAD